MSEYNCRDLNEFLSKWQNNIPYFDMLALMASISKLFSTNDVPYLDYRLTENLFCKYYNAINDARQCTAYDARLSHIGIGIKTFILNNNQSTEKIAEFNKLRSQLNNIHGIDLARKIAMFRNERMRFSNDNYSVTEMIYHVIGRDSGLLRIFNVPYEFIDTENIANVIDTDKSIKFDDGTNSFTFNKSKSVLMKHFSVPQTYRDVTVSILDEPLTTLEKLLIGNNNSTSVIKPKVKGIDYVILPLYSHKHGEVQRKSGLNQWNAAGRPRNENEIYIPIPIEIHKLYPNFFPNRDTPFDLELPDGNIISAKICQSNGKALMSNPNNKLGEWLLRKILKKEPGKIVTKLDLDILGIDSVIVSKKQHINADTGQQHYTISFYEKHENFDSFLS